jgi:hypothetical protein
LDRGTLAVVLAKALRISGGLTMRLTGLTPRYAVRALEFRDIYPPSSPNQLFTGGMFVGVMQKAEEYELGSPADAPASLLPSQVRHSGGPLAAARERTSEAIPPSPQPTPAPAPESTIASTLPRPESLDLAFVPPPRLAIYLDANFDGPPDLLADGAPSGPAAPSRATTNPQIPVTSPPATEPAVPATTAPTAPRRKRLNVIVSGVEGSTAEVRRSPTAPWEKCRRNMSLRETAEFRTGPRSSIQFFIPPDQTFCLDSDGAVCVLSAVAEGKKVLTGMGLENGRLRVDVARPIPSAQPATQPIQIEESGLAHDAYIRSPHSALALRGTEVSLFEQDGFDPEAISLTGRAVYMNTRGQSVALGARRPAIIRGDQTSAVQQALIRAAPAQSLYLARTDFETREIAIVLARGGFVIGDVVVGNLHLSDFPKLPGALDFVLSWTGTPQSPLNDLNLAVYGPDSTPADRDLVANPPFIYSLNPNSPKSKKIIAASYPSVSRTGGRITENSVGPDGLEIAYWPKGFPTGGYRAFVFDLVDAKTPPTTQIDPVTYSIDVYLNGTLTYSNTDTIGLLQQSGGILETIPPATSSAATNSVPGAHNKGSRIAKIPRRELRDVSRTATTNSPPPFGTARTLPR